MAVTTTHTASWGLSSEHAIANAVCLSWNETAEPIMAPEHNEVGAVIGQAVYDIRHTVRATYNIKSSLATGVSATDTVAEVLSAPLSVSGYYITNIELVESNQDYMKVNLSLEKYEHCTTSWNASAFN